MQAIAGIAEAGARSPGEPAAATARPRSRPTRAPTFRRLVEAEQLEPAQALLLGAIEPGATATELRPWFTGDRQRPPCSRTATARSTRRRRSSCSSALGWERADTVLPHLVPTIVYGTREDKLPYMRPFVAGLGALDLDELAERRSTPDPHWQDDGRLLGGPARRRDRTEAALAPRSPRCAPAPASTACSTRSSPR